MKTNRKNTRQQIANNIRRNLGSDSARAQWKSSDKPARTVVLLGA